MHAERNRRNRIARRRVVRTAEERAWQQRIRRMSSALEAAFRIPDGDQFVAVLGTGTERCNRDALHTWVSREIGRLETEFTEQQVPILAERLHRTLTVWDLERGWR